MTEVGSSPIFHHTERETEAHRREVICPKNTRKLVADPSPESLSTLPFPMLPPHVLISSPQLDTARLSVPNLTESYRVQGIKSTPKKLGRRKLHFSLINQTLILQD